MTDEERILDLALGDALEDIRKLVKENDHFRRLLAEQEVRFRNIRQLADVAFLPPYDMLDESTGETD